MVIFFDFMINFEIKFRLIFMTLLLSRALIYFLRVQYERLIFLFVMNI